ncbi:hypothetical protein DYB32_007239, partial [Aphanomyces invadans]
IAMIQLPSLPPTTTESPTAVQERKLARMLCNIIPLRRSLNESYRESVGDVLESATIMSINEEDIPGFERNITQLKVYYNSFGSIPEVSVLEARTNEPNPYFKWFMSQLLQTVRDAIADCAEVAYPSLNVADAAKMLIFATTSEFQAYVLAKKPEWVVKGDVVWFQAPTKHLGASDIPSLRLVRETLSYATELDRIV